MEDGRTRWIWPIVLLMVAGGSSCSSRSAETATLTSTGDKKTQTVAEPETLEMPDLTGLAYPDAVEQALAAGLFPNSFRTQSAQEQGTVVDQDPDAGAQVAPGATIRIDVSLGRGREEERQVPDLTGLELPEALRACAQAGFTCRAVPAGGPGLVVTAERPVPGGSTELAQIELSTG